MILHDSEYNNENENESYNNIIIFKIYKGQLYLKCGANSNFVAFPRLRM